MRNNQWHLVSSQGAVLFYIAANPGCTARQIARDLARTPRTVWNLLGDLRRAQMIHVRKEGRRHHYVANLNAPFRHPTLNGYPLRLFLGEIAARASDRPSPVTSGRAAT